MIKGIQKRLQNEHFLELFVYLYNITLYLDIYDIIQLLDLLLSYQNKMTMIQKYFLIVLTVFLTLMSCRNDQVGDPDAFNPDCEEIVSFNAEIIAVMVNSCATSGCHNQAIGESGYVFENHAQIEQHADMIIAVIRHQPGVVAMPIGQQLPQEFIEKFYCWMEQGKQNN